MTAVMVNIKITSFLFFTLKKKINKSQDVQEYCLIITSIPEQLNLIYLDLVSIL